MRIDSGQMTETESKPSTEYIMRVYPAQDERDVSLADLWRAMWSGKWHVIACTGLVVCLAVLAGLLMTPTYRAEVVITPALEDRASGALGALAGQFGGLAALAGVNLGGPGTAEAIATLRSRALTERFIGDRNLMPILFPAEWNAAEGRWAVKDEEDVPTMWDAYKLFDKSIRSVSQNLETGLVTVSIEWNDPVIAANWANEIVDEVNTNLRQRAIEQSKRSLQYLQEALDSTSEVGVRTAVFSLMESEMKKAMLANVKEEFAFEVIDPAVVPEVPHSPSFRLLVAIGTAAGLILGLLIALVRGTAS